MDEKGKVILKNSVNGILKNYSDADIIMFDIDCRMPIRQTMIDFIKGIRSVLFPGYFDEKSCKGSDAEYFVGHNLSMLYDILQGQVLLALNYDNKETDNNKRATEICDLFFSRLPHIQELLFKDVQAGFDGDPAAKSKEDVIFSYPGFFAIFVYRLAHELYVQNVPLLPRVMTEYAHGRTGIDINSGATIGEYFFIDHGTGVVIGETTEIGDHVKLYQGVTLGALSTRSGQLLSGKKRHPTVEDNVTIYANSTILGGDTVIGANSVIGGNTFITSPVASDSRVSIKDQELNIRNGSKKSSNDNFFNAIAASEGLELPYENIGTVNQQDIIYCDMCGSKNPSDSDECWYCGYKFKSEKK